VEVPVFRLLFIFIGFFSINCAHFLEGLDYSKQESWRQEHGKSQSPINIQVDLVKSGKDLRKLELKYSSGIDAVFDNGHALHAKLSGSAKINGRIFSLLQAHFHSPSEHHLNEKEFPVELHFVHIAENGKLAVIGVFLEEGAFNQTAQDILDNVAGKEAFESDLLKLIPDDRSYFHYLGSLTTPPLTENVEWYVMEHPVTLSKEQIKAFHAYYYGSDRDLQGLNGRPILYFNDTEGK
jgi:carbonic anhydrase